MQKLNQKKLLYPDKTKYLNLNIQKVRIITHLLVVQFEEMEKF